VPFPKKFTDAEIYRLYEEYRESDKDLKTFLEEKGYSGRDYFAIRKRFDNLERRLAKGLPPITTNAFGGGSAALESVADEAVAAEVVTQTAREAGTTARWKFILGDKLWRLYSEYAAHMGWDISKISEHPIDEVFAEALRKSKEYDEMKREVEELRRKVALMEYKLDPLGRLEIATNAMLRYIKFAVYARLLGINVAKSPATKYYSTLINGILTFKPLEVSEKW